MNVTTAKYLSEQDKKYVWHPLTQHKTSPSMLGIVKARAELLFDAKGKTYIDAISSWYTAMYGHGNPMITDAMHQQMRTLDFVMFSGFTHIPAVALAKKLLDILPKNQKKIFFNDNGSTAIEAAIKMALQYHFNQGKKRNTLIAFENGFHGDTFGAMSVSGLSSYNGPFEDFLLNVERIPAPTEKNLEFVKKRLKHIIKEKACAAFVFEPLVQGAAGMKFHSARGLDELIGLCQEHDVLCIADEIMTGFGKTGRNFASDYLQYQPDIICLSKALTAGMFPLSVTSCTQVIFDAFLSDEVSRGFFHAHTYSAHPLGCAAALAALNLLDSNEIKENINEIAKAHKKFVDHIKTHPKVQDARTKGVIMAVDLKVETQRYGALRDRLYQFYMDRGVNLRPLGNTVYTVPPYIINQQNLQKIYSVIEESLSII